MQENTESARIAILKERLVAQQKRAQQRHSELQESLRRHEVCMPCLWLRDAAPAARQLIRSLVRPWRSIPTQLQCINEFKLKTARARRPHATSMGRSIRADMAIHACGPAARVQGTAPPPAPDLATLPPPDAALDAAVKQALALPDPPELLAPPAAVDPPPEEAAPPAPGSPTDDALRKLLAEIQQQEHNDGAVRDLSGVRTAVVL